MDPRSKMEVMGQIKERPLVSILVNCYNSSEYLESALRSIFNQSYQNFEVIFVDNCSTDNSKEIALGFGPKLKYVKTEKNIPLYAARNVGLDNMSGDLLCVLDADDYWQEDKLFEQVRIIKLNQADFIFTKYRVRFEEGNLLRRAIYRLYELFKFDSFREGFLPFSEIVKSYPINLQTVMIKREKIEQERFNDKLNHVGDMEFFLRIIKKYSLRTYFLSKFTSISRMHSGQLSHAGARRWLLEMRYIFLFSLMSLFEKRDSELFKHEIDLCWYQYFKSKNERKKAINKISKYKFYDLIHFYHFLKTVAGK